MVTTLRLSQKCGNEWMAQINNRNHKPPPLFSHVNGHATLRNHLSAAARMEGRRAAGSSFEGASGDRSPSEAEKGRGSWGSIRGPEERNCTNQAVNKLTKPETCGDHDSDLKKPYPHPDLHRKKKNRWMLSFKCLSPVRRWERRRAFVHMMVMRSNPGACNGDKPAAQ